jgi:hypothetical protein
MQAGVVWHACNSTTQEEEVGRSRVPGQPRQVNKTLLQRQKFRQKIWDMLKMVVLLSRMQEDQSSILRIKKEKKEPG